MICCFSLYGQATAGWETGTGHAKLAHASPQRLGQGSEPGGGRMLLDSGHLGLRWNRQVSLQDGTWDVREKGPEGAAGAFGLSRWRREGSWWRVGVVGLGLWVGERSQILTEGVGGWLGVSPALRVPWACAAF